MVIRRGPIARQDGNANTRRSMQPSRKSKNNRVQTREGSITVSDAQSALLTALVTSSNNAHVVKNDMETMSVYSRRSTNTIKNTNYNSSSSIKEEWLRNFKPFPIPSLQNIAHTHEQDECVKGDSNLNRVAVQHVDDNNNNNNENNNNIINNNNNNNKKNNSIVRFANHHAVMKSSDNITTNNNVDVEVCKFDESEFEIANTHEMHFDRAVMFVNLNYVWTANEHLRDEEESNEKMECWHTLRSAHEACTSYEYINRKLQWEENVLLYKQIIITQNARLLASQPEFVLYYNAEQYIAEQLNRQYCNIGFDSTEFSSHVNNNVINVTQFLEEFIREVVDQQNIEAIHERQSARSGKHHDKCILLHYNGHGVENVTKHGDIWFANLDRNTHDNFRILNVLYYLPCSAVVVMDCNRAGYLLRCWQESDLRKKRPDDFFFICACRRDEELPRHPALPADVLTSSLTTPLRMALEFHIHFAPQHTLIPNEKSAKLHAIPGSLNDITTPRGELNFILSTITFTIAWGTFDPHSFTRVFCTRSRELKALFCNALLADRILRSVSVTPQTFPALPTSAHIHFLWNLWDYTLSKAIQLLVRGMPNCTNAKELNNDCKNHIDEKRMKYDAPSESSAHHSQTIPEVSTSITTLGRFTTFFKDQLTAFESWVNAGDWTEPPCELPSVLNAIYYAEYRTRATTLLLKYFDICPGAVGDSLLCGLLPIMQMLMKSTPELLLPVMMMWAKVIQVCPLAACAAALSQTNYFYEYFMYILELKANVCDWIEIKCGEVAPVHEDKLGGVDMEVEIKRYVAAKKNKLEKAKPIMSTALTTLERKEITRTHEQHSLPSERESNERQQEQQEEQQREEREQLQQQEEMTKQEELQGHKVHEQKWMRFYLLEGVSLERCKCIACYVLCELLEWAKEEEDRIQLWNSSLLNITLPLLSSTSATSLSTPYCALSSDATRVELRSWSCLLLSQLALHLPHAKEVLSRECTLHLYVFTSLLSDDSPLVRSSCVTLLANIMGTRIDRLSHEDQLKRLRMEILMLSRLRACLPDASMAVRSEVIYFACQVLYHYCPVVVQVKTWKAEHAEHLQVASEQQHYQHEEQQQQQQQQQQHNNSSAIIRESEQQDTDTGNNNEKTHEGSQTIQDDNININTPTNYIRNVLHNLTNLTLDKIEWMNVERDISVHSKLSENRPTLNVAFDDTILFETTRIESSNPLLSHSFDVNKPTDKSITLIRCLLHDAETMLYYLYANCDAERVRCALHSMLVKDKDTTNNDTSNNFTMSMQKGNSAHDERLKRRHVSRNQELASSAFSRFSYSSSSSLPPLHRPRSYRFVLYAKNTMSRVWTDVNATPDHISESDRTRERWNDDTMKQLVLDFQDRKRQFRPAISYICIRKNSNINNNNHDDVNDTSVHKEELETNNAEESPNAEYDDKGLPENTNDINNANYDNNGGNGDKDEHHEQKNREYADIDSNNAEIELSLIQAPCHQILHSQLNPSSVVCSAFRALEPSVMMVNKSQTFMYMSYSDFHSLKLQNKFKLNAESAPICSICVINDLSEEAGLLVVNNYGGMKLVKNCFTLSSHTMDETENNNNNNNNYGSSSKNTIEPEIVATFAACPPFSAESMMRSMSARGTELTQRAEALKERRVINLKLHYHSPSASLIYGGSIGDNNETEVHVLSLHHEQVAQKLRLGESTQLTSLASHPTQQALIAGCKDGSLYFFDKRQRERGQFGLLKSFKHNPAQVPVITAAAQSDKQIVDDARIIGRRTNTRLNSLIYNSVGSINKQNISGITTSHLTAPIANIKRYENDSSNTIIKVEVNSTFAPVSNAVLGAGIFARNGYYTFITASPSSVNVFDSRKTNEPIAMHRAHDLYHLYSPHDYDQLFVSCETDSIYPEQCYSHRTAPFITSCTISPFTELVGLTFSDDSYGIFNNKMELLHDKLVIAEAFRDTHATSESSSNLFLSPYSIFNSAFAHSHLPSSLSSSPSSLSTESSMLPSKSPLKPILSSSANIHPLRLMMTFGGSVLSYHQL